MFNLNNKVALITGASRGIGKGIALVLGEAGATVYITGRTVAEGQGNRGLPGTIQQTAKEITSSGGQCTALRCDHRIDSQVKEVFELIINKSGRLDILVNNVWGGYESFNDIPEFINKPNFWDIPISLWDDMVQSGPRAHYVASTLAAPIMITQKSGLIINISFIAAQCNDQGVIYSVAKSADDRMVACIAYELREHNVAAVSIYPGGLVRTEWVMRTAKNWNNLDGSESPQYTGRAVAALASDVEIMQKSGRTMSVADLAKEYSFTDIDGKQPGV